MSVAIKTPPKLTTAPVELPPWLLYRFTVKQYRHMNEIGILTENDRVELLEGWITTKMPRTPPHDAGISLVQAELTPRIPAEWILRIQSAINTSDSEPEPDVAVVRGPARRYAKAHPKPRDIGLLVEAAESTLLNDRNFKGRIYARARIPVYWILNLVENKVEVYTQPKSGRSPVYQQRRDYGIDEVVPLVIEDQEIARIPVRDLLPF